MREQWRPVAQRPDRYEVSNLGRVRSVFPDGRIHILRPCLLNEGYHRYSFRVNGKMHHLYVHRLVAAAFLGDPTGLYVRHLNGDVDNNTVENLAIGTPSENNQDTLRHGRHHFAHRSECSQGHEYTEENTYWHNGGRHCRSCNARAVAAYKARVSTT